MYLGVKGLSTSQSASRVEGDFGTSFIYLGVKGPLGTSQSASRSEGAFVTSHHVFRSEDV